MLYLLVWLLVWIPDVFLVVEYVFVFLVCVCLCALGLVLRPVFVYLLSVLCRSHLIHLLCSLVLLLSFMLMSKSGFQLHLYLCCWLPSSFVNVLSPCKLAEIQA